jgi:hypothetical protein
MVIGNAFQCFQQFSIQRMCGGGLNAQTKDIGTYSYFVHNQNDTVYIEIDIFATTDIVAVIAKNGGSI